MPNDQRQDAKYPGGMIGEVPKFNAENRRYVEESNATKHPIVGIAWLTGGRVYCSRECAGSQCIPFAFPPKDAYCGQLVREKESDHASK